jgi:membrane-bound ClpP family serine protease
MMIRVRKSAFAALVALAALLLAMVPVASAAPLSSAEGAPNDSDSSPTGYYIFHNDDAFDIRTHGPGAEHNFDAVLRTDGTIDNVTVQHLENGDTADLKKRGHELVLHFHTFGGTDGVHFTVAGAEHLRLDLKLDGKPIGTDSIFIGPQGKHPKHNPFGLKS